MLSVRIVTTDHYMAPPVRGVDVMYSDFRGSEVSRVPVMRIYGATEAGQKTCMHLHGVFPYLYVPYDGSVPVARYLRQVATSIDKALNISMGRAASTSQHVYKIALVSAIPFYGYHDEEHQFLKIYLYNPYMVKKVADLVLGGAVMNKILQPYESHIPYNLQVFIDYNLYGMNMIKVTAAKFRQPEDGLRLTLAESADRSLAISTPPEETHWDIHTIPRDAWLPPGVARQSSCELEVDVVAADILNRIEIGENIGTNPGLAALWDDERQRRRDHQDDSHISPPSSPDRGDIHWTDAEAVLQEQLCNIVMDLQPYISEFEEPSPTSSQRESLTPSSQVESHHSFTDLFSQSSQDTVILEGIEEKGDVGSDTEPIVNETSILQIISSSQSFHGSAPKPSNNMDNTMDQQLAQMLASMAEDDCQVPASQCASQAASEAIFKVSTLEEADSVLSHTSATASLQAKPTPEEDEEEKQQEQDMLELSQSAWGEDNITKGGDLQGTGDDILSQMEFDLGGMDQTWNSSQWVDTNLSKDDQGNPVPQYDGPADDKSEMQSSTKKRLGMLGPRLPTFKVKTISPGAFSITAKTNEDTIITFTSSTKMHPLPKTKTKPINTSPAVGAPQSMCFDLRASDFQQVGDSDDSGEDQLGQNQTTSYRRGRRGGAVKSRFSGKNSPKEGAQAGDAFIELSASSRSHNKPTAQRRPTAVRGTRGMAARSSATRTLRKTAGPTRRREGRHDNIFTSLASELSLPQSTKDIQQTSPSNVDISHTARTPVIVTDSRVESFMRKSKARLSSASSKKNSVSEAESPDKRAESVEKIAEPNEKSSDSFKDDTKKSKHKAPKQSSPIASDEELAQSENEFELRGKRLLMTRRRSSDSSSDEAATESGAMKVPSSPVKKVNSETKMSEEERLVDKHSEISDDQVSLRVDPDLESDHDMWDQTGCDDLPVIIDLPPDPMSISDSEQQAQGDGSSMYEEQSPAIISRPSRKSPKVRKISRSDKKATEYGSASSKQLPISTPDGYDNHSSAKLKLGAGKRSVNLAERKCKLSLKKLMKKRENALQLLNRRASQSFSDTDSYASANSPPSHLAHHVDPNTSTQDDVTSPSSQHFHSPRERSFDLFPPSDSSRLGSPQEDSVDNHSSFELSSRGGHNGGNGILIAPPEKLSKPSPRGQCGRGRVQKFRSRSPSYSINGDEIVWFSVRNCVNYYNGLRGSLQGCKNRHMIEEDSKVRVLKTDCQKYHLTDIGGENLDIHNMTPYELTHSENYHPTCDKTYREYKVDLSYQSESLGRPPGCKTHEDLPSIMTDMLTMPGPAAESIDMTDRSLLTVETSSLRGSERRCSSMEPSEGETQENRRLPKSIKTSAAFKPSETSEWQHNLDSLQESVHKPLKAGPRFSKLCYQAVKSASTHTSKQTKCSPESASQPCKSFVPSQSASQASESIHQSMKPAILFTKSMPDSSKVASLSSKLTSQASSPVQLPSNLLSQPAKSTTQSLKSVSKGASECSKLASKSSTKQISESLKVPLHSSKSISHPSKSMSQSSNLTSHSSKYSSQTSKSPIQSSKSKPKSAPESLISESYSSKSTSHTSKSHSSRSHSSKSVPESSKAVSHSSKSTLQSKSTSEPSKSITHSSKSALPSSKSVSGSLKAMSNASKPASQSSKSASEFSKYTSQSSKLTSHPSKSASESSKSVTQSSKPPSHLSKSASEFSKSVTDSSKLPLQSSKSASESSKSTLHSSKSTSHSSKLQSSRPESQICKSSSQSSRSGPQTLKTTSQSTKSTSKSSTSKSASQSFRTTSQAVLASAHLVGSRTDLPMRSHPSTSRQGLLESQQTEAKGDLSVVDFSLLENPIDNDMEGLLSTEADPHTQLHTPPLQVMDADKEGSSPRTSSTPHDGSTPQTVDGNKEKSRTRHVASPLQGADEVVSSDDDGQHTVDYNQDETLTETDLYSDSNTCQSASDGNSGQEMAAEKSLKKPNSLLTEGCFTSEATGGQNSRHRHSRRPSLKLKFKKINSESSSETPDNQRESSDDRKRCKRRKYEQHDNYRHRAKRVAVDYSSDAYAHIYKLENNDGTAPAKQRGLKEVKEGKKLVPKENIQYIIINKFKGYKSMRVLLERLDIDKDEIVHLSDFKRRKRHKRKHTSQTTVNSFGTLQQIVSDVPHENRSDPLWEAQIERLGGDHGDVENDGDDDGSGGSSNDDSSQDDDGRFRKIQYSATGKVVPKKRVMSYHKRLSNAFCTTKTRRPKRKSEQIWNTLSLLHDATVAKLTTPHTKYEDEAGKDHKTDYVDVMYKLALFSPPESEHGGDSLPQPMSPAAPHGEQEAAIQNQDDGPRKQPPSAVYQITPKATLLHQSSQDDSQNELTLTKSPIHALKSSAKLSAANSPSGSDPDAHFSTRKPLSSEYNSSGMNTNSTGSPYAVKEAIVHFSPSKTSLFSKGYPKDNSPPDLGPPTLHQMSPHSMASNSGSPPELLYQDREQARQGNSSTVATNLDAYSNFFGTAVTSTSAACRKTNTSITSKKAFVSMHTDCTGRKEGVIGKLEKVTNTLLEKQVNAAKASSHSISLQKPRHGTSLSAAFDLTRDVQAVDLTIKPVAHSSTLDDPCMLKETGNKCKTSDSYVSAISDSIEKKYKHQPTKKNVLARFGVEQEQKQQAAKRLLAKSNDSVLDRGVESLRKRTESKEEQKVKENLSKKEIAHSRLKAQNKQSKQQESESSDTEEEYTCIRSQTPPQSPRGSRAQPCDAAKVLTIPKSMDRSDSSGTEEYESDEDIMRKRREMIMSPIRSPSPVPFSTRCDLAVPLVPLATPRHPGFSDYQLIPSLDTTLVTSPYDWPKPTDVSRSTQRDLQYQTRIETSISKLLEPRKSQKQLSAIRMNKNQLSVANNEESLKSTQSRRHMGQPQRIGLKVDIEKAACRSRKEMDASSKVSEESDDSPSPIRKCQRIFTPIRSPSPDRRNSSKDQQVSLPHCEIPLDHSIRLDDRSSIRESLHKQSERSTQLPQEDSKSEKQVETDSETEQDSDENSKIVCSPIRSLSSPLSPNEPISDKDKSQTIHVGDVPTNITRNMTTAGNDKKEAFGESVLDVNMGHSNYNKNTVEECKQLSTLICPPSPEYYPSRNIFKTYKKTPNRPDLQQNQSTSDLFSPDPLEKNFCHDKLDRLTEYVEPKADNNKDRTGGQQTSLPQAKDQMRNTAIEKQKAEKHSKRPSESAATKDEPAVHKEDKSATVDGSESGSSEDADEESEHIEDFSPIRSPSPPLIASPQCAEDGYEDDISHTAPTEIPMSLVGSPRPVCLFPHISSPPTKHKSPDRSSLKGWAGKMTKQLEVKMPNKVFVNIALSNNLFHDPVDSPQVVRSEREEGEVRSDDETIVDSEDELKQPTSDKYIQEKPQRNVHADDKEDGEWTETETCHSSPAHCLQTVSSVGDGNVSTANSPSPKELQLDTIHNVAATLDRELDGIVARDYHKTPERMHLLKTEGNRKNTTLEESDEENESSEEGSEEEVSKIIVCSSPIRSPSPSPPIDDVSAGVEKCSEGPIESEHQEKPQEETMPDSEESSSSEEDDSDEEMETPRLIRSPSPIQSPDHEVSGGDQKCGMGEGIRSPSPIQSPEQSAMCMERSRKPAVIPLTIDTSVDDPRVKRLLMHPVPSPIQSAAAKCRTPDMLLNNSSDEEFEASAEVVAEKMEKDGEQRARKRDVVCATTGLTGNNCSLSSSKRSAEGTRGDAQSDDQREAGNQISGKTNKSARMNDLTLPGGEKYPLRECTKCEQCERMGFAPAKPPPSKRSVTASMGHFGGEHREAFYSDANDAQQQRPREVGGRILKVRSPLISDLPDAESLLECQSLDQWQSELIGAHLAAASNTASQQSQGFNIQEEIAHNPQFKASLLGNHPVVITPTCLPPSRQQVVKWMKAKALLAQLNPGEIKEIKESKRTEKMVVDKVLGGYASKAGITKKDVCVEQKQMGAETVKKIGTSTDRKGKSGGKGKVKNPNFAATNRELIDNGSTYTGVGSEDGLLGVCVMGEGTLGGEGVWPGGDPGFKTPVHRNRRSCSADGLIEPKCDVACDDIIEQQLGIPADSPPIFMTPSCGGRSLKRRRSLDDTPPPNHSTPRTMHTGFNHRVSFAHTTPSCTPIKRTQPLSPDTPSTSKVTPYGNAAWLTMRSTQMGRGLARSATPPPSGATPPHPVQKRRSITPPPSLSGSTSSPGGVPTISQCRDKSRPLRRLSTNTQSFLWRLMHSSQNKNLLTTQRSILSDGSQIEGATPKNTYGFKVSKQNVRDAKALHEFQYITALSLEVHPLARGELCPDPACDSIVAIFYSILNDVPPDKGQREVTGAIVVDVASASEMQGSTRTSSASQSLFSKSGVELEVVYVSNEEKLIEKCIELIKWWDPDILVGWDVQSASWGYLLKRAAHLSINLCERISRVTGKMQESHHNVEKDEWGADTMSEIHIAGRIVINLWRVLRHEVNLNIYTFENVMYHVLHRRVPKFSFRSLTMWWQHRTHLLRWRVIEYFVTRAHGNLQIMDQIDLIGQTSEFARVFGIEFYHVLSRGSQYRVESMMLRIAKPMNFAAVSPSMQQRARQKAPECVPLTLEPESRFYTNPVVVLDFQSLYPSIMIAYNYCYSTCLGRLRHLQKAQEGDFEFGCSSLTVPPALLKKLQKDVNICPNGVVFTKQHIRKGIISRMVEDILQTRLMVKKSMKQYKDDKTLQRLLHARQLGLKLIANVTYGYTAASFSGRMACVEVGDSIVTKARETLERAIKLVENSPVWDARVVYGDTDSMFISLPGRTKDEAFRIGQAIADAVTADNPKPIKLKFEKVYLPCVLQTKKRYVGFMYETPDQKEPVFDAKGIETIRRDGCGAVSKILERSLKTLFTSRDMSLVKQYVQQQLLKLLEGRADIQDFIFAKEYRGMAGYKAGATVPALEIARRRLAKDRCSEPHVGERVPYVIVYGTPGLPLIQLVREPQALLADPSLRLNATYYITKAILPPLGRAFGLMGVDVQSWYADLPRISRIVPPSHYTSDQKKGTISQYFTTLNCPVCEETMVDGQCPVCQNDPQRIAVILGDRIHKWERTHAQLSQVCYSCMRVQDTARPCTSLDCPVLFRMLRSTRDIYQVPHLRRIQDKLIKTTF